MLEDAFEPSRKEREGKGPKTLYTYAAEHKRLSKLSLSTVLAFPEVKESLLLAKNLHAIPYSQYKFAYTYNSALTVNLPFVHASVPVFYISMAILYAVGVAAAYFDLTLLHIGAKKLYAKFRKRAY